MGKVAIITQSYKNDYRECKLLCESIDRFAPDIDHYIFANDEDLDLFQSLNYGRHHVRGKSAILPWYMIRLPWRMLGHHYHVSPLTMPVREWIVQQICKLGVFEVIGDEYDIALHLDSEIILLQPFNISQLMQDGRYIMFKADNATMNEPSHEDYISAAGKLLKLDTSKPEVSQYDYISLPACFVRENTTKLLNDIKKHSIFHSWKLALCNTYRFSEYYLYGIHTSNVLNMDNHYYVDYRTFCTLDLIKYNDAKALRTAIDNAMADPRVVGVVLQKSNRKLFNGKYLDFNIIEQTIKAYWNN
jgi:hypothetical protein